MFSRLIIDIASVVLAASGLGALAGGAIVTFVHGRPVELNGIAGRRVRETGYFGAGVGLVALFFDLLVRLY